MLYMQPTPTGDEPHYILYSHSLVFDGDADLSNNYDQASIQRYFPYYTQLDPHGREYLSDGTLHSIHYLGLPILISPLVFTGGGVGAVRALMVVLSAVLAHQLFGLLRDSRVASVGLVWLAWAATALSLPLVSFSGQIFPELPGALIVVLGTPDAHWQQTVAPEPGVGKRRRRAVAVAAFPLQRFHGWVTTGRDLPLAAPGRPLGRLSVPARASAPRCCLDVWHPAGCPRDQPVWLGARDVSPVRQPLAARDVRAPSSSRSLPGASPSPIATDSARS